MKYEASKIKQILRTYGEGKKLLQKRLAKLTAELKIEIDNIYEQSMPGATQYDRERVMSTPKTDGKYIAICAQIQKLEGRYAQEFNRIADELSKIDDIVKAIYECSPANKVILMTVYLENRTYENAADILNIDKTTVCRRLVKAIRELTAKVNKTLK